LLSIATPKLKRVENSIKKIEITLEERDNTEQYKLYGDLLTANLYKKADFKKGITLTNYMNNTEVLIPLDETKTMSQNAQKYFRLYNKFKNTKIKSMEILNELKIERDYMENIIYSINVSVNTEELKEIESELGMSEIKPQKISESKLMKLDINGFEVYVGKNNKQNDYIVSKLSKDNDYWFHTKLCAGSHVLLKTENIEPDEKTIFECAKLARQYSSSKMPSKVSVIYTKRKFLKKPPTAPLGYVTYRNEKEILI
jgi:predicted ribosome quality control (RQC) complex YloA/Tae2 family protein